MAIAGTAAYFSVYGLAYTFGGVFWSVVAMGASLEAGKLIAASYLYRYWDQTHLALKTYLMLGVAALMVLTSTGIFGYLSQGYQQDVLPLKQKTEQVRLLDAEKTRTIERKQQIDSQIAGLPSNYSKSRVVLMKQFEAEQNATTNRITELDSQLLALNQSIIETEAHIGPITYIASVFGLPSDDATKYLILIIILAFDPMAVALTLAVNNVLRIRREEKEGVGAIDDPSYTSSDYELDEGPQPPEQDSMFPVLPPVEDEVVHSPEEPEPSFILPIEAEPVAAEPEFHMQQEESALEQPTQASQDVDAVVEPDTQRLFKSTRQPLSPRQLASEQPGNVRELLHHYKMLKSKLDNGEECTAEELSELEAIARILQTKGVQIFM